MRIGIMQPYFFPYAGYFALIAQTDTWAVFDTSQYTPKSWMTRNRILHPRTGWMYVSVPLDNGSQSIRTMDARVLDVAGAHDTLVGQLGHYRRRAPYWRQVNEVVDEAFSSPDDPSLAHLNVRALAAMCAYLELEFSFRYTSDLDDQPEVDHPGGWAPALAARYGASEYLNPLGGAELFKESQFEERGITLRFLEPPTMRYATGPFEFVPDLSILDVAMWNTPEEIRAALASARILSAHQLPAGG